jgi:aconitate hydratase
MYENISAAADILAGGSVGDGYFDLSVYPASPPIALAMTRDGLSAALMEAGAVIKPAFCGPCFGAGDTPANATLSIRHATRNFASREGSKPGNGQMAAVALMDARSIAATARNGGILTAATDINFNETPREYKYDDTIYAKRVYNGFGKADKSAELRLGPNITDWPKFHAPEDAMLLQLCAVIRDGVTTTDELIPSGETSSYRSNPIALAEFTLSRRAPEYVSRSKAARELEELRRAGGAADELTGLLKSFGADLSQTSVGSCLFAKKPGDGSAREQAASCQRVLGGLANICYEYATKRYRSNCVNWGVIPFTIDPGEDFPYSDGDWIYIPALREGLSQGGEEFGAAVMTSGGVLRPLTLYCAGLTRDERSILLSGCLMNYYAAGGGV